MSEKYYIDLKGFRPAYQPAVTFDGSSRRQHRSSSPAQIYDDAEATTLEVPPHVGICLNH
jgi:hypothetical protein